jgi:BMFP domain-containing protein YqiC
MADKQIPTLDPFALWREWIVKSEQQWSEGLTKLMKDDRVAEAMGKQLQQARFLQKMFGEMMQPYLAGMNLPSRTDIESLEERLGKVEDGLAALQAQFVQLRTAIVEARAASPESAGGIPRLPRTRKSAAEGTAGS